MIRIAVQEGLLSSVEVDRLKSTAAKADAGLLDAVVDSGLLRKTDVERIRRDRGTATTRIPGEIVTTSHHRFVPDEVRAAALDARSAFGRYTMVEKIGSGGMGTIWKAWDNTLGRWCALKMLHEEHAVHEDHRERFLREARAAARLAHPNIVQVYEVGMLGSTVFMALEYVPGETFRQRIAHRATGPELRRRIELVRQAAEGLGSAHAAGITHRDMKPENVLVLPTPKGGQAKVTDFGLAVDKTVATRLTIAGDVFGTPAYMSPEQALGLQEIVGPSTDVFAVGCILYEVVTGRLPFDADQAAASVYATVHSDPESIQKLAPRTHRDLETIILKCIEKDPPRRYQDAKELADDLGRYMAGEPIRARPVGFFGRLQRKAKRNPALAVGVLAAVALPAALGGIWAWKDAQDRASAESALGQAAQLERAGLVATTQDLTRLLLLYQSVLRDYPENLDAKAGVERVDEMLRRLDPGGNGEDAAVRRRRFESELAAARAAARDLRFLPGAPARHDLLVQQWPEERLALEARAELWWRLARPRAAIADLYLARKRWDLSEEGRRTLVLCLVEEGRVAEATDLFAASSRPPDMIELAAVRLAQGRLEEARAQLARDGPDSLERRWVTAQLEARIGGWGAASPAVARVLEGEPAFLPAAFARLAGTSEPGLAEERAREIVESAPWHAGARVALAVVLARSGDFAGAMRQMDRGLELEACSAYLLARAHVMLSMGDPRGVDEIRRWLRR